MISCVYFAAGPFNMSSNFVYPSFFHFIYALKDTRMQIASPGQGKNAKVNPDIQSWSKHHKYQQRVLKATKAPDLMLKTAAGYLFIYFFF